MEHRWLVAIDHRGTHVFRVPYESVVYNRPDFIAEKTIFTNWTEYVSVVLAHDKTEAEAKGLEILRAHFPEAFVGGP